MCICMCVCECVHVNVYSLNFYGHIQAFVVLGVWVCAGLAHTGKENCIFLFVGWPRLLRFLFFPFHFNSFQFWFQWFCCNRMKTAFRSMVSLSLPAPTLASTSHSLTRPLCLLYTAWIGMLNAWLHFILAVILFILSLVLMFTNFKHIHLFLVNIHKYTNTHTRSTRT